MTQDRGKLWAVTGTVMKPLALVKRGELFHKLSNCQLVRKVPALADDVTGSGRLLLLPLLECWDTGSVSTQLLTFRRWCCRLKRR